MSKSDLTERQNQAFEYISAFIREHSKPPTMMEIGKSLGINSTNGVSKLLKTLEAKGYLIRESKTARGLRVVGEQAQSYDDEVPSLPLIGRVASDEPQRLRKTNKYFNIDYRFLMKVNTDECLVGIVSDDGMNQEGIRKNDYIVIEECALDDLPPDSLVACLVREQLKVRYLSIANSLLHLSPANRHYTIETFPPESPQCYVIGRVISVMRKLA